MSVVVKIEHSEGAFGREVVIERVTGDYAKGQWREFETSDTYKVTLYRALRTGDRGHLTEAERFIGTTTIKHRYGHNLLVLVQEAMEALLEAEFERNR